MLCTSLNITPNIVVDSCWIEQLVHCKETGHCKDDPLHKIAKSFQDYSRTFQIPIYSGQKENSIWTLLQDAISMSQVLQY